MTAQIKRYNGNPVLFLDGKPVFDAMMWGSAPAVDGYPLQDCARLYGEAGVKIFAFDIGASGSPPDWVGPRPDAPNDYDFSLIEKRFGHILAVVPDARFHLRIHLEMPEWWQKIYPEECELGSKGIRYCQSFASKIWRQQAKEYLRALAGFFESIGWRDKIVAYQTGAGITGEWVKRTGGSSVCGDYSRPMMEHFRSWLRDTYQNDEDRFRQVWNDPDITFDTAVVPPASAQDVTRHFTFRDPTKEQNIIDYYRCLAELCGDLIVDFAKTVKEATHGTALAGAFYGYLMELAWNSDFFGDGTEATYSGYQRSGHLGLAKVLASPDVDFLVSPLSYGFRGIGGDGPSMLPTESLRLHNKLYIYEEDSRMHISRHDHPNYGKTDTLEENIAILKRNLAYVVTHGHGIWWLAGGSQTMPHIELSQQPAFQPLIKKFVEIGNFAIETEMHPSAEIAVILDDDSFYYETIHNDLDFPLIFQQRLWGLSKIGAPYDLYLLNDLLEGKVRPYQLYIFLNPFFLDDRRREALKSMIRSEHKTALWIYAPGYINQTPAIENMTDLTGISFGRGDFPWGQRINIINFSHPITQGLREDTSWGTDMRLGPLFHVTDPGCTVLGNVVYSQGRCVPGFVVRKFTDWVSIYSAAPNIPPLILQRIAKFAGVHIYNEAGDTFYATPNFLSLHTAGGGERLIRLPKAVEVVYDLFDERVIANNTKEFLINLEPISTVLYYTGSIKLLEKYINKKLSVMD